MRSTVNKVCIKAENVIGPTGTRGKLEAPAKCILLTTEPIPSRSANVGVDLIKAPEWTLVPGAPSNLIGR